MANLILDKAKERGLSKLNWLTSYHSFSFADYYDPKKVNFGKLRVLNDDEVVPSYGFGTHHHENMEIISLVLSGELHHKDSIGNSGIIKAGEVQVMSAGTGILHSEFNNNNEPVKFLQIWVYPNKKDVEPRYQQKSIENLTKNEWHGIVYPKEEGKDVWVYQNTWFSLGEFEEHIEFNYKLKNPSNGVYFFVIEGSADIINQHLEHRDALGVKEMPEVSGISKASNTKILAIEVPL